MWNTVILPILTSLTATGLGILIVWIFNTKRRDDKIANEIARITNKIEAVETKMDNGFNQKTNEIARITNKIEAVETKMDNGFNRETLEKDILLNAFNTAKTEMEQANEKAFLKQRELSQNIIERIHAESIAREEFSQIVKTSIDNLEKEVSNIEKEVSTNKNLINRILGIVENHAELIKRAIDN